MLRHRILISLSIYLTFNSSILPQNARWTGEIALDHLSRLKALPLLYGVELIVGSNGNGRHYQDQTDRKNEQTMTQDKDLIFAQHTFFCFSATAQVAHLVLPDTQRQRFAKPKEPLFPYRT